MTDRRRRLLAVCLAVGPLVACDSLPFSGEAQPVAAAVEVVRADMVVSVPARGELNATDAKPIAVPRVPTGALKVREVVDEGSIVAAGDVVLVFDDTELNIQLDNHKASFRSADRRIDRTKLQSVIDAGSIEVMRRVAELERDNADAFEIADEGIYSKLELLESTVAKEEAEETILFADASLVLRGEYYDIEERILGVERTQVEGKMGRVETSLASLVLKAPLGGLIIYKKNWRGGTVSVGDTLWPGNVVLSIVDPGSTRLDAFLLEKDAAGVEVGDGAIVTIDARPDRQFRGEVTSLAEISRPIERGSPVKYTEVQIEIAEGDPVLLKPGMKGEARIVTEQVAAAIVVPRSAVRGARDDRWVLVESAAGRERRDITLGPGGLVSVSVATGLAAGERVLLGAGAEGGTEVAAAITPPAGTR